MTDYSNSKIYSIRSYQTNDIYIGSSSQTLSRRLTFHRANYKRYLDGKYHYVTSFEILKHDDYYIELLEIYPCKNNMELHKREGELIRQNDNAINKVIPGRTRKEYNNDNKENIKIRLNKNKDKIKLQRIKRRENKKIKMIYDNYLNDIKNKRKLLYDLQLKKINEMIMILE